MARLISTWDGTMGIVGVIYVQHFAKIARRSYHGWVNTVTSPKRMSPSKLPWWQGPPNFFAQGPPSCLSSSSQNVSTYKISFAVGWSHFCCGASSIHAHVIFLASQVFRPCLGSLLLLHKRRRIDLYRSNLVLTKNYACRAGSPERTKQKS